MSDPDASQKQPTPASPADADLEQWTRRLTQALQILDLRVDHALLADLAERSSQGVGHASAPVTSFVVGYAAGLSAATGSVSATDATSRAADVAVRLLADARRTESQPSVRSDPPEAEGWLGTAQ